MRSNGKKNRAPPTAGRAAVVEQVCPTKRPRAKEVSGIIGDAAAGFQQEKRGRAMAPARG